MPVGSSRAQARDVERRLQVERRGDHKVGLSVFGPEAVLVWPANRQTRVSEAMKEKEVSGGVAHDLPADLKKALTTNAKALATWEDITPLARNEWICWIESAKKAETRTRRIEWGCSSLKDGKRKPCCWAGCPHR